MQWTPTEILKILDECCDNFTFPMLDNGYVYPAATQLSLYRSPEDWGIVIEVFGYSPRSGIPDTQIYTFASRLNRAKASEDFVNPEAFEKYLANNPYNESTFIYPIDEGDWQDPEDEEFIASERPFVAIRGELTEAPSPSEYAASGVILENPMRVAVFEYCRLLADTRRRDVLAKPEEQRINLPPDLQKIIQLEEWNHPDIANNDRPSLNETFKELAKVLVSGDVSAYRAAEPPNSHWSNWPEGGTL